MWEFSPGGRPLVSGGPAMCRQGLKPDARFFQKNTDGCADHTGADDGKRHRVFSFRHSSSLTGNALTVEKKQTTDT